MKKISLILGILLIFPISTAQCGEKECYIVLGGVALLCAGYYVYNWHQPAPIVPANNEPKPSINTQTNNEKPQDPADNPDKKDPNNDPNTYKPSDEARHALNQQKDKPKNNPAPSIKTSENSEPAKHPAPILERPKPESKPFEANPQPKPGFLEKLRNYSADYEELHKENRDIFEG